MNKRFEFWNNPHTEPVFFTRFMANKPKSAERPLKYASDFVNWSINTKITTTKTPVFLFITMWTFDLLDLLSLLCAQSFEDADS